MSPDSCSNNQSLISVNSKSAASWDGVRPPGVSFIRKLCIAPNLSTSNQHNSKQPEVTAACKGVLEIEGLVDSLEIEGIVESIFVIFWSIVCLLVYRLFSSSSPGLRHLFSGYVLSGYWS